MTYYVRSCDCKGGGCKTDAPAITAKEVDGVITFTMTIALYRCSVCGAPWKQVQEEDHLR
jgi:hypothetical protein